MMGGVKLSVKYRGGVNEREGSEFEGKGDRVAIDDDEWELGRVINAIYCVIIKFFIFQRFFISICVRAFLLLFFPTKISFQCYLYLKRMMLCLKLCVMSIAVKMCLNV